MTSKYDVLLRLLLVGDTGVGKTCLLCRYTTDEYIDTHISTLGIDFKTKFIPCDGRTIKAQIWDTAGQERFESITQQFYRKAEFTVDSPILLLVGNKSDNESTRQVTYEQGQDMADSHDMKFYEVSAKNSLNITEAFLAMIHEVTKNETVVDQSGVPEVTPAPREEIIKVVTEEAKSGCCVLV